MRDDFFLSEDPGFAAGYAPPAAPMAPPAPPPMAPPMPSYVAPPPPPQPNVGPPQQGPAGDAWLTTPTMPPEQQAKLRAAAEAMANPPMTMLDAAASLAGPAPARGGGGGGGLSKWQGQEVAAMNRGREAQVELGNVQAQNHVDQAGLLTKQAAEQHEQRESFKRQYDDFRTNVAETMAKRDKFVDEIAQSTWSPKQAMFTGDAGRDVAFGILSVLNGIASGNSQAIDSIIDKSHQRYQAEIEKKKSVVGLYDNKLAQLRQVFGDDRAADEAFRLGGLEEWKTRLAAQMHAGQAPEVLAKLKEEVAATDQKIAQTRGRFDAIAQSNAAAGAQAREKQRREAIELGLKIEAAKNDRRRVDIDDRRQRADEAKAQGAGPDAAKEDAAFGLEVDNFNRNWKSAASTVAGSRLSSAARTAVGTDTDSKHEATLATLGAMLTPDGAKSDADWLTKVKPKLPKPNDDEETVAFKQVLAVRELAQKHPQAAARLIATNPQKAVELGLLDARALPGQDGEVIKSGR